MDETTPSGLEDFRAVTSPEPEPMSSSFIPTDAPMPPRRPAAEPPAPPVRPRGLAPAEPAAAPAPRSEPLRASQLYDFLAKGFSGPEFQSTGERVVNPETGRVSWGSSDNPADFVRADRATMALRQAAETRAEAPAARTERAAPAARAPERASAAPMAYAPAPSAGGTPLLRAISAAESNNRPTAQNPRSSAGGLFQFTDGTWGSVLRRMAPDQYAGFNNLQLKPLKTRADTVPLQQQAADFHINRDILPALARAEIPPTPGNIYLAWFQGPAGAVRAYSASPNATVAEVFPKTVRPNANLRFNGKPYAEWTMNDLRTWADRTVSSRMRADGGRVSLLQDEYPTQYLPNVGRQVMALGGVLKEEEDPVVKGALNLTAPKPKRLAPGELIDFGGDGERSEGPLGGILGGAFTAAPDVGSAISVGGAAPSVGAAPTTSATPGVVNSDVTEASTRGSGLTRGITVDDTPSARGDRPGWAGSIYSDMVDPDGLMTSAPYNFGVEPPAQTSITPYSFAENTALSGLPGTQGYGAQVGGLFSGTTSTPSSTPSAAMADLYGSMGPATVGPSVGPYSFGFIDAKSEDRGDLPGISTSPLSSSIGPYSFGTSMLGATPTFAAPAEEEATPPAEDPAAAVAAPSIGAYAFGPLPDTTYAENVAAEAAPVAEAEAPGRSGQDKFNSMMESLANSLLAGAKTSDLTAKGMALPDVSPTTYTSIANSFLENQALLDQYANPENYNMGPDPNAPAPNAEENEAASISGATTIGALAEALGANQAADAEGMAAAAANEAAAAEAAATADAVAGAVSSAADMSGLSDASGNWGGGWGSGPGEGAAGEGGQGPGGEGQGGQGASGEGAAGEGGQGAGGEGAAGEGGQGAGGEGAGGEGAGGEGGGGSAGDGAGDSGGGGGGGEGGEGGGGGTGGGGGGEGEAAGGRIVDRALRLTARKADGGAAEGSEEPRRYSLDDVLALVSEGDRNAQINDVLRLAQDIERRERRTADVADLKKAAGESFIGSVLKSIVGGAALPGDVAAGRVDPTSIEGIERAADLAGLVTGGSFAARRPEGSIGMGGRSAPETKAVAELLDSPEMQRWRGQSVIPSARVEDRYFHGTSKDKDFANFNVGRHGAWLTKDPAEASMYARENDSMGFTYGSGGIERTNTASRVIPVFARAENPYTGPLPDFAMSRNYKKSQSDWFDQLRARGYDAWLPADNPDLAVILRDPEQIKSAISNTGEFSGPRIDRAEGGAAESPEEPSRYSLDDVLALASEGDRNAQLNDAIAYADRLSRAERSKEVREALKETWPVQLAKAIVGGAALPGDVAAGRVDPTSIEGIERAADLAGLVTGGSFAARRPEGSIGMGGRDDLDALMAQAKARLAERDNLATELASTNKPLRMEAPSGMTAVVQKDMSREDGWRVTRLDDKGPIGHSEYNNAYDAFYNALSEGFKPKAVVGAKRGLAPPSGIRAYHGSPHDFDRFDLSKIGTGEGAQAYGHGLYFAENEAVAKGYKSALTPQPFPDKDPRNAAWKLISARGDAGEKLFREAYKDRPADQIEQMLADAKNVRAGRMYEVNIRANPDEFINFDAPFEAQPRRVQEVFGYLPPYAREGMDLARRIESRPFAEEAAAKGIPGIRYFDAGSRGAGEGSSNFVVFDDKLIDILRKYAQGGQVDSEELDTGNAIDYSRHREGGADDMLAEALRVAREMQSPGRR